MRDTTNEVSTAHISMSYNVLDKREINSGNHLSRDNVDLTLTRRKLTKVIELYKAIFLVKGILLQCKKLFHCYLIPEAKE